MSDNVLIIRNNGRIKGLNELQIPEKLIQDIFVLILTDKHDILFLIIKSIQVYLLQMIRYWLKLLKGCHSCCSGNVRLGV